MKDREEIIRDLRNQRVELWLRGTIDDIEDFFGVREPIN